MKKRLRAIACVGLAVCLASGLWSCARDTGRVPETESGNTTVNYVYSGTYNLSNIPEEPSAGDEQRRDPRRVLPARHKPLLSSPCKLFKAAANAPTQR